VKYDPDVNALITGYLMIDINDSKQGVLKECATFKIE
jgi:hypothetical protein